MQYDTMFPQCSFYSYSLEMKDLVVLIMMGNPLHSYLYMYARKYVFTF